MESSYRTQKQLFQENKLYVPTNLALIRNIGDSEAILLNYLLGLRDWYKKPYIYRPTHKICQDLDWSLSKAERLIKRLEMFGLINVTVKAWPGIHNFHFNESKIRDVRQLWKTETEHIIIRRDKTWRSMMSTSFRSS